ncbi:unnamed protein product [Sphagnum balticum]
MCRSMNVRRQSVSQQRRVVAVSPKHVNDRPPCSSNPMRKFLCCHTCVGNMRARAHVNSRAAYCEHRANDKCSTVICSNGGVCVDGNQTGGARCQCAPGYDGPTCAPGRGRAHARNTMSEWRVL